MRFRPIFLGLSVLLAACAKTDAPVRLDFVGTTNLTSSNRTVNAADTILTYVFAETGGNSAALKNLKISVTYAPGPNPIIYPTVLSTFKSSDAPPPLTLTMLDSTLAKQTHQFLFRPKFGARSTSGTERWLFTASDTAGNIAARTYTLTVRKSDSAAVYQNYPLLAEIRPDRLARVYFALLPGLLLPRFAVNNSAENQSLIDLIVVQNAAEVRLQAPSIVHLPATWIGTKHTTEIRLTTLDGNAFGGVATADKLASTFNEAPHSASQQDSGPLAAEKVLAFHTDDNHYGLIYISKLTLTPYPILTCTVRIQK